MARKVSQVRRARVKPNVGARKAIAAFKKRYGANWKAVYYGRASKYGRRGLRPQQKSNSIYGVGTHVIKRRAKK